MLVACSHPLDLVLPYTGDKLVLNGVLIDGEMIEVNVSRSNAPTGFAPEVLFVDNAEVEVFENGFSRAVLRPVGNGRYQASGLTAQAGSEYRVTVDAEGFTPVVATTVVPNAFSLNRIDFQWVDSFLNPSVPATEIEIHFVDEVQTRDYYAITLTGFTDIDRAERRLATQWIPGSLDEAEPPCNFFRNRRFIYEDRCFNGGIASVAVAGENETFVFNGNRIDRVSFDHLVVRCQRISPELFDYYFSNTTVSGIELAFFEPSFLKSNVQNGYGVLGSANQVIVQQRVER